jgi:hypothetical protein
MRDFVNINLSDTKEFNEEFLEEFEEIVPRLMSEKEEISEEFTVTNKIVRYPWEVIDMLCEEHVSSGAIIMPSFVVEIIKDSFAYMTYVPVDKSREGYGLLFGSISKNFSCCKYLGKAEIVPIGKKKEVTLFIGASAFEETYGMKPKFLTLDIYQPDVAEAFIFNYMAEYFNVRNEIFRFPVMETTQLYNKKKCIYEPLGLLFAGRIAPTIESKFFPDVMFNPDMISFEKYTDYDEQAKFTQNSAEYNEESRQLRERRMGGVRVNLVNDNWTPGSPGFGLTIFAQPDSQQ